MAINFNTNPYYDDFDETKKFHRILFRPGYAVQARELTQLQTQLQDQLKKFGNHVFVNGSIVLDGGKIWENDVISIKIESSFSGQSVSVNNFLNKTIIGQTSNAEATVKAVAVLTETDPNTLIVKIDAGDTFQAGETIQTSDAAFSAIVGLTTPFNKAMLYSIDSGIYYVDGNFVYTNAQTVIVDKYSNTSSKVIGFTVSESTVDSNKDSSLLDNAQGTPNYAAPGADRWKVDLQLTVKDIGDTLEDFIEIGRIVDGELVVNQTRTIYSELGKELARRTFDESGDYTVKKWPIQLLDHQGDPVDQDKFTAGLDRGKGYIKGYEFETISQQFVELNRARDEEQAVSLDITTLYGNYVYVNTLLGEWNTTTLNSTTAYEPVNLYDGGTPIGTANVRHIQWHSGTPSSGAGVVYKVYLFNIQFTSGSFADVTQIGTGSISCQIDALSKIGGTGNTFVSGTDSPGLVFNFPNEYIKTVRDEFLTSVSEYQAQREFTLTFVGGTASIASGGGSERFIGIGSISDLLKSTYYHVVFTNITNAGATGYSNGEIGDFDSSNTRTITVGTDIVGSPQTLNFNINDGAFAGTAKLIATVNLNAQTEKTKSLSNYTYKIISSPNTTSGNLDSLEVSDIYGDVVVYNTSTTNPTAQVSANFDVNTGAITNWGAVPNTDVTDDYTLDDGQRLEFYDHGGIKLTGTAPGGTDYLVVVYRYFTHSGNGFFSVDSYASINYEDIPVFNDLTSGATINLRDAIDFRPIREASATTFDGGFIPDPDGTFNTDYQYYLARIDKIIATSDREFIVKEGVPAIYPKVPTDVTNGMTLYILLIPPYTADVRDISVKYMDNKRYTMRDIGKLEKRINNLEYYTQLSLLEKQAKDTAISDASNLEKFKNGFVVDPFTSADIFTAVAPELWAQRRWGWWNSWFNGSNNWNLAAENYNENSIANAANPDFAAAIDPINAELRAPFSTEFYYFDTGTLTSTVKKGDNVILQYTETNVVEQLLASGYINVNPFNIFRFLGIVRLEPSFDQWVDTVNLPAVNRVVDIQLPDGPDQTVQTFIGQRRPVSRLISTSTIVENNVIAETTANLGATVVDIQFVPFMRSNSVLAVGTQFKPSSRLYGFMENTSIDAYLKPLTLVEVQNHTGSLFNGDIGVYEALSIRTDYATPGTETGTAKTALYSSPTTDDNTKRLLWIWEETITPNIGEWIVGANGGYAEITNVTTYSLNDPIIPDEFGNTAVEFQIPANTFSTGERQFRLINNNTNDANSQDSIGNATYTAIGQIQTKQETFLTTRALQRQRTTTEVRQWYDPVAESFLVSSDAYPNGLHVSSIDVYFRSKSSTVPVTMEIRRTVNGYPESQTTTIPFAITSLNPENVNTSTDASVATTFEFPAIHLTPGEYAITLLANSPDYEVFIAEMGEQILNGNGKVDKQPYAGSLFKSQNASTWEADQNKDLMFVLKRAVFVSSGSAEFEIEDPATVKDYHAVFTMINAFSPTSTKVDWYAKAWTGSAHDTDWARVDINQDIEYTRLLQLDAAANAGGTPTLRLKANLSTTSDQVSPVIDSESLSVVVTENLINNDQTNETNPTGGNALARYITKPITLASDFDASNIVVTIDVNRPPATNIYVYYRTLASGINTPITDESWTLMELESTVDSSINNFDFKEYQFYPPSAFDIYGVPQDNPITPRFNTFQVKIVLASTQTQFSPKLKDLRIIALDS